MDFRTEIVRDKENEQVYLSLLNSHFKTVNYEKHTDAMMNVIFTDARLKVLGKNFQKQRISRRKATKIKEEISNRLKRKYGKWVSLSAFKIKNVDTIAFQTNLDKVFKVPGYGALYGAYYKTACGNIFFTSHSLERFEERTEKNVHKALTSIFTHKNNLEVTSIDILCGLIFTCAFVYGRIDKYIHLALPTGILVLEDLGDVFVAKTFLSSDMIKEISWYRVDVEDIKDFCYNANSFADVVNGPSKKADTPLFIEDLQAMIKESGGIIVEQ